MGRCSKEVVGHPAKFSITRSILDISAAERVFILVNNKFNDQQDNTLEDYLEASVIIRYNNAKGL